MKLELVKNWMTADPITITTTMTLPKAHEIMKSQNIRRLPVVDADDQLVGIITLGDVRGAEVVPTTASSIWDFNHLPDKPKVEAFMAENPYTVTPNTSIGAAANLMWRHKIGGLPVINTDRKLVGIITESDIFEMVVLQEWVDIDAYALTPA